MSNLQAIEYNNKLVVDSRLIAPRLGIQHKTLMGTIRKWLHLIEEHFGHVEILTATSTNSVGATHEYAYAMLTEPQANLLMTFSRNTREVVECKIALVKAFETAKHILKQQEAEKKLRNLQPDVDREFNRIKKFYELGNKFNMDEPFYQTLRQRLARLIGMTEHDVMLYFPYYNEPKGPSDPEQVEFRRRHRLKYPQGYRLLDANQSDSAN